MTANVASFCRLPLRIPQENNHCSSTLPRTLHVPFSLQHGQQRASAASEGSIGLRLIREHSTEAYLKKTKKTPKNGPENRTAIWHHFLRQRYRYKQFRCRQQEHDCAASLQAVISTKVVGRLAADYAMQEMALPYTSC